MRWFRLKPHLRKSPKSRGMASFFDRSSPSISTKPGSGGISYIEAMQLVEDRETHLRSVFNKFDLQGDGSIDMDELMVLLDDLGMLARLRTEATEFVRDMFVKFDTNLDGVLSFNEFIGLYLSLIHI